MDIYNNKKFPRLELVFREDGKFPFLLDACFLKSADHHASTNLFDDPPGKKMLSAVCILFVLAKFKGMDPDKPEAKIRFREATKRISWLNTLGIDKESLKYFFDKFFDGVEFFSASRGTNQILSVKESGGGSAGSVEFDPIKLRPENINLYRNDRSTTYKLTELPSLAIKLEKHGLTKNPPWEQTVEEHLDKINRARPTQKSVNPKHHSPTLDGGPTQCVISPKWVDLFQEKLTEIDGRAIGGNWYVICGTPYWVLQWRQVYFNAVVNQGATIKFAHYAPKGSDFCPSIAAQWKMNIDYMHDPDPMGLLKQRMRDGIAQLSSLTEKAQKHGAKGVFKFFKSYTAHPFVSILIVPKPSKRQPTHPGKAPVGTICLLGLNGFYFDSLEDRAGIYLDRSGPLLNIYYNIITRFFNKGSKPKEGYLKPVDYPPKQSQRRKRSTTR
jgi:hypothetical protein